MQSSTQLETLPFQQARANDLLKQINEITNGISLLKQQYGLQQQLSNATDDQAQEFHNAVGSSTNCATRLPTSTTSSGRSATTSTGNRTVTTSRSVTPSARCSMRSTASINSANNLPPSRPHWTE